MTIERYPLMTRDDDNECADVDEAERDALMADAFDVTNCDDGVGAPDFVQAGQWIADWYIGDVTSYDDLLTEEMQQLVDADERRSR